MNQTKKLVDAVVKGLQEKKGEKIVTVDMTHLSGAICEYMVICEGKNPNQVFSLSESVREIVRADAGERPLSMNGKRNAQWIGMDYGTVLVHIFMPEERSFYNLENLWADSKIQTIPDWD